MQNKRLIGFIPQDDRPVSLAQPRQLMAANGWTILSPPKAFLGHREKPGRMAELKEWLLRNGHSAAGWVLSLDMLVYGGLVPSRELYDEDKCPLLDVLGELRREIPEIPIYAFQSVRRASTTVTTSDDLAKWQEKLDGSGLSAHRRQNHSVNCQAIEWLGKGALDWLALLQEDTTQREDLTKEHEKLLSLASQRDCAHKFVLTSGCDEGAQVLLVKMACALSDFSPHVVVNYSCEAGSHRTSLYEDRNLRQTVKGQLLNLGAKEVNDPDGADVELWVWCPDQACRDLWLERPYDGAATGLDRFVEYVANSVETCGHAVTVADVAYANGACPHFSKRLVKNVNISHLSGFAAWNTAANSIGSALAQGTIAALGSLPNGNRSFLFNRFVEDWAYQTELRPALKSYVVHELDTDPWQLSASGRRKAEKFISEAIDGWCDEHLEYGFSDRYGFWGIDITLPWSRLFEIEIGQETRDEVVITPIVDGG